MSRPYISKAIRLRVAVAARHRCGYCLTSQEYSGAQLAVEHILPLKQGGTNQEENFWLACGWCNSYKGSQIDGIDPLSGERISLFNPRQQVWSHHFKWSDDGTRIIGITACGRVTVEALQLNNEFILPARHRWVSAGWHPPTD
jgi:hypothetical protein